MNYYGRSAIAGNVVIGVFAIVAVTLRILARRRQKLPLRSDDYTILVALLIAIGLCCEGVYTGATGVIKGSATPPTIADLSKSQKIIWIDVFLTNMLYGIIKISILLFYRRIFTTKTFQKVSNVCLVIISAWMISMFFCLVFISSPLEKFWTEPTAPWNYNWMLWIFSNCCLDLFFDFSILCLPLPLIYSLRMSWKRRIQVMSIFGLGFFCIVSSVMRTWYTWQLHLLLTDKLPLSHQPSVEFWDDLWAHIEGGASVVTACLPTLAPFFTDKHSHGPMSSLRRRVTERYNSFSSGVKSDAASIEGYSQNEKKCAQQEQVHSFNSSDLTVSRSTEDVEAQPDRP